MSAPLRASMTVGSSRITNLDDITVEEQEQLDEIERAHEASKPANTIKAYRAPQEEWHQWCLERAGNNGATPLEELSVNARALEITKRVQVTGTLVALYLGQQVIGRKYKRKGRVGQLKNAGKRPDEGDDDEDEVCEAGRSNQEERAVGPSVVRNTLNALVDLWAKQQSGRAERKRSFHVNRVDGTFLDGYSKDDQLVSILETGSTRNTPEGIRDLAMAALSHRGLLRGESVRGITLPDVQYISLENREGPTPCDVAVILLLSGKTNKDGKTQFMSTMRNKRWDLCGMGALAMWLFHRFEVSGETFGEAETRFPDFSKSEGWYRYLLFPGSDQFVQIQPATHHKAVSTMLKQTNLHSKKVTHIFRGCASRMADLGGAAETDIDRAGRWDSSAMTSGWHD